MNTQHFPHTSLALAFRNSILDGSFVKKIKRKDARAQNKTKRAAGEKKFTLHFIKGAINVWKGAKPPNQTSMKFWRPLEKLFWRPSQAFLGGALHPLHPLPGRHWVSYDELNSNKKHLNTTSRYGFSPLFFVFSLIKHCNAIKKFDKSIYP